MFSIDVEKITCADVRDTVRTIATIVGVWIACISYQKYIKNKLLEKQLEQVIKIIEKIKECKFTFSFYISEEQITQQDIDKQIPKAVEAFELYQNDIKFKTLTQESNLFEIALYSRNCKFEIALLSQNYKNVIFKDLKITKAAYQQFQELNQFSHDPLVPKSIAKEINNFLLSDEIFSIGQMKAPSTSANYVIIASSKTDELKDASDISFFSKEENETAFKDWQKFLVSTKELLESIKAWMKSNGITEINL
jgi:hypothetical protein